MKTLSRLKNRQASFGSLAAAHVNFKAELQARTEQTASLDETREAVYRGRRLDKEALGRVANLFRNAHQFQDEISDTQAQAIQGRGRVNEIADGPAPNPDMLPAIFNTQLVTAQGQFRPKWHLVRNLPAYIAQPIRAVGRLTLGGFTTTNLEDVRLSSTHFASEGELREMMAWVRNNGTYVPQPDKEVMTFAGHFDTEQGGAYEAQVRLFEVDGIDFLMVSDNYGKSIYSWPTRDRIGLDLAIENNNEPRRLGP